MNRLKRFMFNGALLSLVAIAMRLAGMLLNVFVTRRLGAEGMGLLSLINSVFGFAVTFSVGGINLAATRLCAQALSRESKSELRSALKALTVYALILGFGAAFFLFFFSDWLAQRLPGSPDVGLCLRLLAFPMPIFSLSAVINGYFTAVRRAWKGAVASVAEQAVKMAVVFWLFGTFTPEGNVQACLFVILGTVSAELASGLLSYCLYRRDLHRVKGQSSGEPGAAARMLSVALPVALSSYIRSGLVTVEHLLIPRGLAAHGADTAAALATYGVVQGMVFPVIFFPTSLLYAFTGLIIPEMTLAKEQRMQAQVRRIANKVLHLTGLFAILCAGLLFVFADDLGMALYRNARAGYYIRVMAPLIPVMYLDSATDALLKGLGEQVYTMKVNVADAFLSLLLVTLLVPKIGIWGYIAVVYSSEIVNLGFSLLRLYRVTGVMPSAVRGAALPCLGVILMLPLGHACLTGFLILRMVLAAAIYLLFLSLVGCIGKEEREMLVKSVSGGKKCRESA